MKIKLYTPFQHWAKKGAIFLYSDPHFNDPDSQIINPNWPTIEEQIKNINSVVGKNDTIIILGDIGDISYIKKIKGYKVLIKGNHDRGTTNYLRKETYMPVENETCEELRKKYPDFIYATNLRIGRVAYLDNHLFDEVYDGPIFISDKILLSHEPIDIPFGINIHGHVHAGNKIFYWADTKLKYNVCSDVIGWKPIRLSDITTVFKVADIHRLTIETAKKNNCNNQEN